MNILNFDTSLDKTYIALSNDKNILDTKMIESTEDNYHSAFLISTIKSILKKNNLTPKDIDLIGVNVGPGSFTGIRAALTVAKVMAQELEIKIVPVSSLKILSKLNNTNKKTLVLLDARRDMAYTYMDDQLQAIPVDDIKILIKSNDYFIISDKSMASMLNLEDVLIYENEINDLGKILNKIVNEEQDSAVNPMELKALYIQPPPVFVKK